MSYETWKRPVSPNAQLSTRGQLWLAFSEQVLAHIEEYTVPQYGDYPDDQATEFTEDQIALNMKRYLNRVGRNSRGLEEAIRDTLKLANYSCMLNLRLISTNVKEGRVSGDEFCPTCALPLPPTKKCKRCGYCEGC